MKKDLILTVTVLAFASLACSLFSGIGGSSGGDEPPAPDAPGGSAAVDLSDSAGQGVSPFPAYTLDMKIEYTGKDLEGNDKTMRITTSLETQTIPQEARHVSIFSGDTGETLDVVIIGDQFYSVLPGVGCTVLPAGTMQGEEFFDSVPQPSELLSGQAKLVESGVEVSGILTDRYELTSDNLLSTVADAPELESGSVYIAQDGGYILKVAFEGKANTAQNGFDPNQDTHVSMEYVIIPVEDGSLTILPPAECADQAGQAGKYPIMEGATSLSNVGGLVFYEVESPLEEVLDFYRTEMSSAGWTLTNDESSSTLSFAALEFEKDGIKVSVNAIAQGDKVAVTITGE